MQMTPYVLLNRFNVRFPFVDAVQLSLVIDIEGMSVFHYESRDDCSFYIYCSNLLSIWIWHGNRALEEISDNLSLVIECVLLIWCLYGIQMKWFSYPLVLKVIVGL